MLNHHSPNLSFNDYYAYKMLENLVVGMNVRCRQSVRSLTISDTGIVLQIQQKELHDFNVQVYIFHILKKNKCLHITQIVFLNR